MMITSIILIILICVGIIYLISNYRKRLRFFQAANALPGPNMISILWLVYYVLQIHFYELLNIICLFVDKYPSPARFWFGNKLLISVSEPDQIKTILQNPNCLDKSIMYEPMKAVFGNGLVTAPAHIWNRHRKMLAPNFNINLLRVSCDVFVKQASIFMEKIEHMLNDEVDFFQHISIHTLENIFEISMDITGLQLKEKELYINSITRLRNIIIYRMGNIFLFPDIIFKLTSLNREHQKHLNILHALSKKIIQLKEDSIGNLDGTKNQSVKPSRRIFLDILMEPSDERKKYTRTDIIDEIITIILAGTDTTATALYFIMFLLANFPEIQQKVYDELLEIYGTQDPKCAPVKFEDLQHMNCLERVIKETLRIFPVIPIIGRKLNEDIQIGKYTLPKGAEIIVSILNLHRNEKYWPNALTFDPDRFLPENMANIHSYSYIPFSNGPRNCIGARYAMISIKVFIATLLRTYILKVDERVKLEEIKLQMHLILAPVNPLKVRIEKRM